MKLNENEIQIDDELEFDPIELDLEFDSIELEDDLIFDPIELDEEVDDIFSIDSYDSTDYTDKLSRLLQHIRTTQNEIKKLESIKMSEIQIPIKRENYSFLDDSIFNIYVDIWKEAIKQGLPSKEVLLEDIYDIFQNIDYSLRLAKSAFEKAYFSDYKLIHNNLLAARKKEEERNTICTPEEQQKIAESDSILYAITAFSSHCNDLIVKTQDLNLNGFIRNYFPDLQADILTGAPIETVEQVQRALRDFTKSKDVTDLIESKLNIDCSQSCPGEVLRLAMIMDMDAFSQFYCPEEKITLDIAFDIINKLYDSYTQGSLHAYLLLCCFSIIICGEMKNAEKELLTFAEEYVAFLKMIKQKDNPILNPALIQELEWKEGKTYAKCSKGGICEINDFYLIAGISSKTLTIPLVNHCHCSNKNCNGCLFAAPEFFASIIDWLNEGTSEGSVPESLKCRITLKPKLLSKFGINTTFDNETMISHEQIDNHSIRWFLDMQEFIDKFQFEEDHSKVKAVQFLYQDSDTYVNMLGIAKDTSNIITRLDINSTTILDGTWEVTEEELILYYVTPDNIEEQSLSLPLKDCTIQEQKQEASIKNSDSPDTAQFLGVTVNLSNKTDQIQKLANVICDLTGLSYEIEIENARNRILTSYYHLFQFPALKDFLLNLVASCYINWLNTEECKNDWVNFSMLKVLLNTIYAEKAALASTNKCTELTPELIEKVKEQILKNTVLNDILEKLSRIDLDLLATNYSAQTSDISKEDRELYQVALAIPAISNILITLENKMVIAFALYVYRKELVPIFSVNSALLKVFKSEVSSESLAENIIAVQKKFKNCKDLNLFSTVSKLLTLSKDSSKNSLYTILKFFILKEELFDIITLLLELEDYDFMDSLLYELNREGGNYTREFFLSMKNKEVFCKQVKHSTIDSIYSIYFDKFLEYLYLGIHAETTKNGTANLLVAYDIITVFYDELAIDLDDTLPVQTYQDFTDDFFRYFGTLYVTYGYVEDEAVMDTSEIKDRAYSFRQHPESFPAINSPYFQSLDLKDLLFIGDGE